MNGLPMVNINGTQQQDLVKARIVARESVLNTMAALSECRPQGRDYQTAQPGEYETALEIYTRRFQFLDKLANELEEEAMAIQDQ